MARSYSMSAVQGAAERAVRAVGGFLREDVPGSRVHDVQSDPRFQHRGVDLLWEQPEGRVLGVEVKGDRQGYRRGNYFFELVSNVEKNSPGCFLYSTADLLAYVFLERLELHLLPLKPTREFFLPRAKDYALKHTRTQLGPEHYTTVGAIVPTKDVLASVEGARVLRVKPDLVPQIEPS